MLSIVKGALFKAGKGLILATLSEIVIKKAVLAILRDLAARTETDIDDKIVEEIAKAWK